ncbi:MAG: DUF3344 domain-containing protein [Euryarchaeota archaeon]|nr:DUF3344 domain-containing protein [Euryarchaeota archaeon]
MCLADNFVGGIPLTSVKTGTVDGGVFCDSYYGTADQAIHSIKTIDKTFTIPANAKVEWAMLLTTVYCGHMQNNYQGTAEVSFNGKTLGKETLNVPFNYIINGGNDDKPYVQVNNHVNRVTSDYMMFYDVTSLVKAGENKATVHTEPSDAKFDGRIKLITLVVAYNDGSGNKIWYQVNRGHDVDTYYSDDELEEDYVGSTAFNAAVPEGASLTDAKLTLVHMASEDGAYTFNGKALTSGKSQGTYCGSNTWDVKDSFKSSDTNTLTYSRNGGFYKCAIGILTAEYTTSSSGTPADDTPADDTPADDTPADDTPADDTPADDTPADDTPADDTPADDTPADDTPVDDTPADDTPADDTPVDDTPADDDSTSGEKSSADLGVEKIKVMHNDASKAWDKLNNTVNVTVINNGPDDAGNFALELYAEGTLIASKPVAGLANGATEIVGFTWKPENVQSYALKAVVVPGSSISDTNATNNELSKAQEVLHNGYVGDKPLETYAHGRVKGGLIYDYGNSTYSNKVFNGDRYSVGHTLSLPEGASVKYARLYNFWTWSATVTTGVQPSMSLQFEGESLTPEAEYSDQKGWGSQYDYPTGTWAYNVTGLVSGSGSYTTMVTNTHADSGNFVCLDGIGLLVVYEDASGKEIEYWVNEGCDMVSTMGTSGGLTPEEAAVDIPFTGGSIDLNNVDEAHLWTTVQSGGHTGISLEFNEMKFPGVYDSTPYSDLDIDEARPVGAYLMAENNKARIVPPAITNENGDYLVPSNAILVVSYKDGTPDTPPATPALSLSASNLNLTVGKETEVTYIVLSSGTPVEGVLLNLSGCATGSGTTDASGKAVIKVNASCEGIISAKASKVGYTGAELSQEAKKATSPSDPSSPTTPSGPSSSATVSLNVTIIPAISLTVSPDSIDFGTMSPGTPSQTFPLTLQNKGGTCIKVKAEVKDQEKGPFMTGLFIDNGIWSSYSKFIAVDRPETAQVYLDLPVNYSSSGQFQGSLIFWAEAA